jgi:DNA-directed RNA polymerase subunit F
VRALLSRDLADSKRLTLSHALMVAKLDHGQQAEAVETIQRRGLRSAQVRHLIETRLAIGGILPRPDKERRKLHNFMERSRKDCEVLMQRTPEYYRQIFAAMKANEQVRTVETLDDLIGDLKALRELIGTRVLKASA